MSSQSRYPTQDPYKSANADDQLSIKQKFEDLREFIKECKFAMMTTRDSTSGKLFSRCMALTATETSGTDLLFFTNRQSHKTDEVASDPHINIGFLDSRGQWASISGTCVVESDRETIQKHYSPSLRAWLGDLGDGIHDGGENDPRIAIIRVKMLSATYSLLTKGFMSRTAELAKGVAKGQVPSVNSLRELDEQDVEKWRKSGELVE